MTALSRIKQANQARKILHDWLGEGGQPVPIENAQARANVCISGCEGKMCPCNDASPHWTWDLVSQFYISNQLRLKETMNIRLGNEDKLHTCSKCGCVLRLKVHVPFQHIYRHMTLEQLEAFPNWCWMKLELGKKTQP